MNELDRKWTVKEVWLEFRLYLAELLMGAQLWLAPVEHKDGRELIQWIKAYCKTRKLKLEREG